VSGDRSRKGRRSGAGPARPPAAREPADEPTEARPRAGLGSFLRGDPSQSPYPTLRSSFGGALLAIGGSPLVMVAIAVLVFAIRFVLVALQVPARGSLFAAALALPPVGTVLDLQAAATAFGDPTGLLVAPAFLIARSLIVAVLAGLAVESLRTGRATRAGALAGARGAPALFGVGVIELAAVFIGSLVIGFAGLGLLGIMLVLVGTLFAFGYAPVIAVEEQRGLQWTVRRSIRAARIPGSQNIFLALIYTVPSLLMLPVLVPQGQLIAATPSIATWIGILLANVFHVVFLAVYCHRYLAAAEDIPDPAEPARAR
jgi:hypothetical protein